MKQLWAPWRKAYIRPKAKKEKGCLFCRLLSRKKDSQNYILKRTRHSFAVLNLYPYNNGHVMVVPQRHTDSVRALTDAEKLDWLELYEAVREALQRGMKAHGINVGMNLGKAAGAGVLHHLHLHLVPRWEGDTNFMPVIAGDKIISESLKSVYKTLLHELR